MKIFYSTIVLLPILSALSPTSSATNTATTTRYWDCSGGACGCAYLPSHLGGSHAKPAHCHSNAMFSAPAGNPYGAAFYGAAAISQALGGGDWLSEGCGKCWKVKGTSNIPNYDTTTTTTLVLKGTNYCPPANQACSGGKAHFDIAAPGFDFIGASLSNTCAEREPDEKDAFASCGNWMISNQNPTMNCNCDLFSSPVLKAGCKNFKSLSWDNPTVTYEEVSCPPELSALPCWAENGNNYHIFGQEPELCMDPAVGGSNSSPANPTSPIASPTKAPTSPPVSPTTPPNPQPSPTSRPVNDNPSSNIDSNNACCSQDFKTCVSWCNESKEACESCPNTLTTWLDDGPKTGSSCRSRWEACTNNQDGCCNGLVCVGDSYYMQCQHPEEGGVVPDPVPPPPTTPAPTSDTNSQGNTGNCGTEWSNCFNDHDSCCNDYYCDTHLWYAHCRRSPGA